MILRAAGALLIRSPWFWLAAVAAVGGLFGAGYYRGHTAASTDCEIQKERRATASAQADTQAAVALAGAEITAAKRAAARADDARNATDELTETIREADGLVGCGLSADELRRVNAAYRRITRGPD